MRAVDLIVGETVLVGREIRVTVMDVLDAKVRLRIDVPPDTRIEVMDAESILVPGSCAAQ